MQSQGIREKIGRFRILVVGRANAGKTTLLQRVCNTTDNPEVFDGAGEKIDAAVVKSTVYRGYHDIKNEVVLRSNPDFVFHDAPGFEAGGEDNFEKVKEFVLERASTLKLKERIHAIWYCIPMDEIHRAITKYEERFFSECDTSSVPVIAVFTKFDALWDDAYEQLRDSGLSRSESKRKVPEFAKAIFAEARIWDRLCENRYPPKAHVNLAEMEKDNADCGPLLECTAGALGEEAVQMLLISTQQTNLALCVKFAVQKTLILYINKARTSTGTSSWQLSKDTCIDMQQAISVWFPNIQDRRVKRREVEWWEAARRLNWAEGEANRARARAVEAEETMERKRAAVRVSSLRERPSSPRIRASSLKEERVSSLRMMKFRSLRELTATQVGNLQVKAQSASLTLTLQLGIALIIILEHSFILSQEGKQEPDNFLDIAAAKYKTSQTQTSVEEAVKEVLQKDDGNNEKLGHMVEAIILHNRMS